MDELFCGRSAVTRNVLRNITKQSSLIETNLVKPYWLINFSDMTFPQGTYRSLNYLGKKEEKIEKPPWTGYFREVYQTSVMLTPQTWLISMV